MIEIVSVSVCFAFFVLIYWRRKKYRVQIKEIGKRPLHLYGISQAIHFDKDSNGSHIKS